jgi:hypothetical protein
MFTSPTHQQKQACLLEPTRIVHSMINSVVGCLSGWPYMRVRLPVWLAGYLSGCIVRLLLLLPTTSGQTNPVWVSS